MNKERVKIFFEFLVFGIIMGLVEDIIAVMIVTGEPITLKIVGIITLVTIPFALVGEFIVNRTPLLYHIKR